MKRSRISLCIYFILQIVVTSLCDVNSSEDSLENAPYEELIDPHSFYYNRHRKEMEKPINDEIRESPPIIETVDSTSTESSDSVSNDCEQNLQECKYEKSNTLPYELFSKRLVNMLLSHVIIKEEDEIIKGHIHIEASRSQIQVLRDFGSGKVSIRQVDSVLSDIIRTPTTTFFEDAMTYSELFLSTVNTHKNTCIGILVVISVLFISRYITWTRGAIILLIIDLIFVISFFMTWYQLVKEAEIKQTARQMMYAQMPIECQPEKMGIIQNILSKISFRGSTEECEKYYEARIMDPVVQVTPAHALSHLCTNFILHPVSLAGHMVGSFVENATGKMAWPMKWVVTLLLFIGVALLIIMLPFSLFGGSIRFGLGPLFHFNLSGAKQKEKKRLSGNNSQSRIELIQEKPASIAIHKIKPSPKDKTATTKIAKLQSEKEDSNDEKALPESRIALIPYDKAGGDSEKIDGFNGVAHPEESTSLIPLDKAGGDSATINDSNEGAHELGLSNTENCKKKSLQQIGSGDR